jgi:hypothetical protein
VDQFTKWVEAVALPDQTAETVARAAVDHFFVRFGCPLEIVTDQGTNFTSQLFTELCQWLGITKKRTSAYHPSANGQVERMNKTIMQTIRCNLERGQDRWEEPLQRIIGAIRCTVNRSTGFTPNRLMLGREVTQPLELMTGVQSAQAPTSTFVAELEKDLLDAHAAARTALGEQQRRQKKEYTLHTHEARYQVGDVVLLSNSATKVGNCKKLTHLWKGPLVVTKVLSPVLYQVGATRKSWVVHHDRLRPCYDTHLSLWISKLQRQLRGEPDTPAADDGDLYQPSGPFADEPLYCSCHKPDDGKFMICCDSCQEWFHGRCVQVTQKAADRTAFWACPECRRKGIIV